MANRDATGVGSQPAEDQPANDVLFAPPAAGTVLRPTVRVLLIDEADRVLLLRAAARAGGPQVWFAVGGGIEQGEEVRAAAVREVREETGLAGLQLGPEVWRRRHLLEVDGAMWDLRERWYLARVAGFVPGRGGFTEWERARISDMRWWTVPDLVATDEQVAPADLGALIEEVFRNGPPSRPLVIGA